MLDLRTLSDRAAELRQRFGEDPYSPMDIFALAQSIENLTLVFYPLGRHISGVCIEHPTSAVIAVNSGTSLGRQRFTLAHELYHYYFGNTESAVICPLSFDNKSDVEKEADRFASYLLIPQIGLKRKIQEQKGSSSPKLTVFDVVRLEQYFQVSRQAMLMRLQQENELAPEDAATMQQSVRLYASALGYDPSLYLPTPEDKNKKTYGHYIKQAENLLQKDAVSTGKYEQWLLEALRDDIVYGDDSDGGETVD